MNALWEREHELRVLREALDTTRGGSGRLVVIEGPAGVGKSGLLQAARNEAAERGLPVLAARGMELERGVPFGLARQLFVPPMLRSSTAEQRRLLAGPAALAAPLVAGTLPDAGAVGEGQAGVMVEGLYWLAVNLARSDPSRPADHRSPGLVIIVDDGQWADRSSLRFLIHAVGQLDEIGLCVLLTIRTGEPETPVDLLGRLRGHPGCARLSPERLSPRAVSQLIRAGTFPAADEDFCAACSRVSGGNPFLLVELLTVLAADGAKPTAETARRVAEWVPDSVLHAVVMNLGRRPPAVTRMASAVAVLDEAPLSLAAALAELDLDAAEDAAEALTEANLLAPGEPLSFVHPLIAAAVLTDLRPIARSRLHRRAAALLASESADVGRIAAHLLNTRPRADSWVSTTLRRAGLEALAQKDAGSAVRLLRRALAEQSANDDRDATLIGLAHAEAAADSPNAAARLAEALDRVTDPRQRATVFHQLTRLLFFKGDIAQAADAAERGLAELDPQDEMAPHLLSAYLTAATFDSRLRPAVGELLDPYLPEARAGHVPADPLICAHLCARMAVAGDPAPLVVPVAEQAFCRNPLVDETAHGVILALPVVALVIVDHLDRATAVLETALTSHDSRRSLIALTVAHHWLATVCYRRGQLVDALANARRAQVVCRAEDWSLYGPWISANLAQILVEQGDLVSAEAVVNNDSEAVDPIGDCLRMEARGRLAMAKNDPGRAYDLFTEAGQKFDAMGLISPGFMAWRSSAATAAGALGHRDHAADLARTELELARRIGTPRSIGVALRVLASSTPDEHALLLLSESVTLLDDTSGQLENARSLAALGAALRRTGQRNAARRPLQRALDIATRAGADPLAQHAAQELRASGSRPRRTQLTGIDALTPTERRIAELAAQNRTNPQIARDLYVTTKTVEWHLAHVFRKLEITGRRQLTHALGNDMP
jgi:DNA-binding CsgD family transcriptional regulator